MPIGNTGGAGAPKPVQQELSYADVKNIANYVKSGSLGRAWERLKGNTTGDTVREFFKNASASDQRLAMTLIGSKHLSKLEKYLPQDKPQGAGKQKQSDVSEKTSAQAKQVFVKAQPDKTSQRNMKIAEHREEKQEAAKPQRPSTPPPPEFQAKVQERRESIKQEQTQAPPKREEAGGEDHAPIDSDVPPPPPPMDKAPPPPPPPPMGMAAPKPNKAISEERKGVKEQAVPEENAAVKPEEKEENPLLAQIRNAGAKRKMSDESIAKLDNKQIQSDENPLAGALKNAMQGKIGIHDDIEDDVPWDDDDEPVTTQQKKQEPKVEPKVEKKPETVVQQAKPETSSTKTEKPVQQTKVEPKPVSADNPNESLNDVLTKGLKGHRAAMAEDEVDNDLDDWENS